MIYDSNALATFRDRTQAGVDSLGRVRSYRTRGSRKAVGHGAETMVTLRAFLALLAGFLTIILCTAALTALFRRLIPSWVGEQIRLTPAYVIVNLGYSFLAASAGGYVTAWIAHGNPLYHVLMLGIIVLGLAALSALQSRAGRPV